MSYSASHIIVFMKSQVRKFWWNLSSHLTIVLSASALFALFMYIFKDFVGHQLSSIDAQWSKNTLSAISIVIADLFAILLGRWTKNSLAGEDSLLPIMRRSGVGENEVKNFVLILRFCAALLSIFVACFINIALGSSQILPSIISGVILCIITSAISQKKDVELTSKVSTIIDWRRHQLIHRSIPGKRIIIFGIFCSLLAPLAAKAHTNLFLLQLALLTCGLVSSLGIIQAVASELPGTWFEKQAGLTHNQWINSWQHIANAISLILAASGGIVWASLPTEVRSQNWALPFIAGFLPWLMPSLILQVEGRAKNINMMIAVLIGLFFGTAMAATPWAAVALPLVKTQAKAYQNGRFYRA